MSAWAIIGAFLQIALLWFKAALEKDAEKKKKKQELLKEADDALKNRDTSALSCVFDKLNSMR